MLFLFEDLFFAFRQEVDGGGGKDEVDGLGNGTFFFFLSFLY